MCTYEICKMLQDFAAFLIFICISIFSWIISYSDFEELLICYGCNQIDPQYDFVIGECFGY